MARSPPCSSRAGPSSTVRTCRSSRRSRRASCSPPRSSRRTRVSDGNLEVIILAALDEAIAVAVVDELPGVCEHRARRRFDVDFAGRDMADGVARFADLEAQPIDTIESVLRQLELGRERLG